MNEPGSRRYMIAIKTLGVAEMAELLHKTPRTIREDARRRPHSLPPRLRIPGSDRMLWLESDVAEWLEKCRVHPPARRAA
jgi:predicted DNA-binding transcriptional regulator AlpA